jgi:hypothetical protein
MILSRRNFLVGLLAAPVIVQASSIMRVKPLVKVTMIGRTEWWDADLFDYGKDIRVGDMLAIIHPKNEEWLRVVATT